MSSIRTKILPIARDLAADWKCWSVTERVAAVAVLGFVVFALSIALSITH